MAMTEKVRDIAYALGLAVLSPVWGYRLWQTGKWRTDWSARLGRTPAPPPDQTKPDGVRTLLFHAVSVGEVNLIRQLVAQLQNEPNLQLVIATTTDTGLARAKALYSQRHRVVRYPLDFSFAVRRFLDAIRPDAVALVELEVWPNFVSQCTQRNIPVAVINGRLSDRSIKRYRWIVSLVRGSFAQLKAVGAQDQRYAQRFVEMGVPQDRVAVLDTMKWDTADTADDVPGSAALAQALGIDRNRPLVVLGSTGEGEETQLTAALTHACPPDVQFLIVPRKPERFDEVAAAHPGIVRRTRYPDGANRPPDGQRYFLLDTMGELRKAYALADVVLVGRSFNGWGASDPIEPAALGKPTLIGPSFQNFTDVVHALAAGQGIIQTQNPQAAAATTAQLLSDRTAAADLGRHGRQVVLARQGATRRHAQLLLAMLKSTP
ncbi:MAG: hypothetical protein IT443_09720 [Phycisphaeraceae bacterium]|nr:hypothetical protein [Phycisphaeraceae bacterium]